MGRAIMIDNAHLVVAQTVDAVLVKKKLGVLNQKLTHLRFFVVEHQPAGMAFIGKVK